MAKLFGQPSRLRFVSWEQWRETTTGSAAELTFDHIAHSPSVSIDKARRLLDYEPQYTSLEAISQSLEWLISNRKLVLAQGAPGLA